MSEDLDALWAQAKPVAPTDDLEALWGQAKPVEKMGAGEAAMLGLGQGMTLGFGDELMAAETAAKGRLLKAALAALSARGQGPMEVLKRAGSAVVADGFGDEYRALRDQARAQQDKAEQEQQGAYIAGNLAGGLVLPIPGGAPARGASLMTKLGRGALGGAAAGTAYGAGASKAEDIGGIAKDAAVGAALGGAGGALGAGVGAGLSRVGGRAARGIAEADEAIQQIGAAKGRKAEETALAELRNAAQATYRAAEKAVQDKSAPPEVIREAEQLLARMNAGGTRDLPGAVSREATARATHATAAKTTPELVAAATEHAGNPLRVAGRLAKRYAVPAVSGALGAALGGPFGFGVGALAGRGASPSVNAVVRAMREPAMKKMGWQAVQALTGGARLPGAAQRGAGAISRAVEPELAEILLPAYVDAEEERRRRLAEALLGGVQ